MKKKARYISPFGGGWGWTLDCFSTPQPPPKGEISSRSNFNILCKYLLINKIQVKNN